MGALVGLFYRDGRPIASEMLAGMASAVAHRSPAGTATWCLRSVGFSMGSLWPTALVQQHPGTLVAFDARLDNRAELRTALAADLPAGPIDDAALLLAAYRRWGSTFPERLLGDFVLAIWDEQARTLFCARDQFGVRPLYYYCSERVFAFASELKALLALAEVPDRINSARAHTYLAGTPLDATGTFYAGIVRLPAAHTLTVTPADSTMRRYWALDPTREIRLRSDAAYAEQFRAIFVDAVRCRLDAPAPVGTLLSGGLDSSAVTCTARALRQGAGGEALPVFSASFPTVTACDETSFIDAVLAQGGYRPHGIVGDAVHPWGEPQRRMYHMEEPHHAPGVALRWGLLASVRANGVGVILDGSGGDEVVSHGEGYLYQLARNGHWPTLALELYWTARSSGAHYGNLLWEYLWFCGARPALRGLRRQLRGQPDPAPRDARHIHLHSLTTSVQPLGLEVLDRVAAAYGIEVRYPFWDRRLVEFCLALPPEQKLRRGQGRYVLRAALRDTLPDAVRLRGDKVDFLTNLIHGMRHFERDRVIGMIHADQHPAAPYLDLPALRAIARRVADPAGRVTPDEVFRLWRAITFSLWVELHEAGIFRRPGDAAPGQSSAVALGRASEHRSHKAAYRLTVKEDL